ncbi:MAG TPA: type 4a pilus biogenesis protein PilO [Gaiellaceae bacterium]|nr:type 4a pilus biogenesis protein PilO [Gaiellaceae bacterium]
MSQALPRPVLVALFLAADVLLLGLGWFLVVTPQRHHAATAAHGVAVAKAQILEAKSFARPPGSTAGAAQARQPAIRTSLLYRVMKAMPDTEDQPDLLLQLDQVARAAGVQVLSIAPGTPTAGDGFSVVPIELKAQGNFYSLTDMLYRLRALVAVHHGALDSTGRLFSVDVVTFTPVGAGRQLTADVDVQAFVYGTELADSAAAKPASTSTTDTSTTATDSTTSGDTTTTDASGSGG